MLHGGSLWLPIHVALLEMKGVRWPLDILSPQVTLSEMHEESRCAWLHYREKIEVVREASFSEAVVRSECLFFVCDVKWLVSRNDGKWLPKGTPSKHKDGHIVTWQFFWETNLIGITGTWPPLASFVLSLHGYMCFLLLRFGTFIAGPSEAHSCMTQSWQ